MLSVYYMIRLYKALRKHFNGVSIGLKFGFIWVSKNLSVDSARCDNLNFYFIERKNSKWFELL